jgi:hypothetical protein
MDRATALSQLPETYAEALRLRDAGLSDEAITSRLGVPAEAMSLLLGLAEAKLAHLMAADEPPPRETHTLLRAPEDRKWAVLCPMRIQQRNGRAALAGSPVYADTPAAWPLQDGGSHGETPPPGCTRSNEVAKNASLRP